MLQAELTKNGTGLLIYGTYTDLDLLYNTIHHFTRMLDEHESKSQDAQLKILMNFAYEVRKAKDSHRLKDKFLFPDNEQHLLFGFQVVWTDIIIFINCLRHNAGYNQSTKLHQAVLYSLEHIVEEKISEYDPKSAENIKEFLNFRLNITDSFAFIIYQAVHIKFVEQKPGLNRFKNIPTLLTSHFSKGQKEYNSIIASFTVSAMEQNCEPTDLEFSGFPEIFW